MLTRLFLDEQAVPVQVRIGDYWVQHWWNETDKKPLIMATFPVIDGRLSSEGQVVSYSFTGQPVMAPIYLPDRVMPDAAAVELTEHTAVPGTAVAQRTVMLAWLLALWTALVMVILLVAWLRLR